MIFNIVYAEQRRIDFDFKKFEKDAQEEWRKADALHSFDLDAFNTLTEDVDINNVINHCIWIHTNIEI